MIAKTRLIKNLENYLDYLPAMQVEVPEDIFISTENARCKNYEVFIKEGDYVKCYQKIGVRHGPFFDQPIHSTCSGTFIGYEKHYHRSGKLVNFMHIKNDFKDEPDTSIIHERSDEEIAKLTREDIMAILKDCASVGLGGSSFPTYIKFDTKGRRIDTILINGIECEPYIMADHTLMMEQQEKIIQGIKILQQAFGTKDARICFKKHHKDLKAVLSDALKRHEGSGITLSPVGNFYPQGWEVSMIKSATGINVSSGHLPSEYGIINFNVSTVVGIYDAVKYNKPVIERNITVTGDGIKSPSNFLVRVGTPIRNLIGKCGGYKDLEKPKLFILGGPMMGASLATDDCIASKTVTSIIVLNYKPVEEENCARCGSCVLSCPVGLKPVQIMNAVKAVDKETIKLLEPLKCIECGLCTYSCTCGIHVTDYVRKAKTIAKL